MLAGVTTWSHPLEDHFRSLFLQMKSDKARAKGGQPSRRPGGQPFPSPRQHHLDDSELGDGDSEEGGSLGTSLSMSRSATSVRGRDQQWEPGANPAQPFIRSYGASGDLGSSLAAARAVAAAAAPPPLPNMSAEADTASAPVGQARRGKQQPRASSRLSSDAADGGQRLPPIKGSPSAGWLPPTP